MEQKLFVYKYLKYAEEKYCKKINSDFYVFYSRAQTVKYSIGLNLNIGLKIAHTS